MCDYLDPQRLLDNQWLKTLRTSYTKEDYQDVLALVKSNEIQSAGKY